jgi:hypothetical protein
MIKSINHPWAVTDKFRERYGNTWADMDFIFEDKISADNFKTDPMAVSIGTLHIDGKQLPMRYKDLISYSKSLDTFTNNMYAEKVGKQDLMLVSVKGTEFTLRKHEVAKLYSTISDALESSMRAYELGLYL